MSETVEKRKINQTAKVRIEAIHDRYQRSPTENELRAIEELPLGRLNDLNDRSEVGKEIWRILEEFERNHDVSLLEEAGRLLWQQVTSRPEPYSKTDSSPYPFPKEDLAKDFSPIDFSSYGSTKGGPPKDGELKSDKSHRKIGNRKSGERGGRGGRVVNSKKSVKEPEHSGFRQWDSSVIVPPTKRAKLSHAPSMPQDIQSQAPHTSHTYLAQGQSGEGHDFALVIPSIPAAPMPTYSTAQRNVPFWPRTSATLATSPSFTSQSSGGLSRSSSPTNFQPSGTPDSSSGLAARQNHDQRGNRQRPHLYALGNSAIYTTPKGV